MDRRPMIVARDLTRTFGPMTAVDRLTFEVAEGEIFGFLGPNGAGKTTTVRMLCCLISKSSGEATVAGYQIGDEAHTLDIRKQIGLVADNVGLYEELSAYDNLDFYAQLYDCATAQRRASIERFLKMLDLWDKRDVPVGDFSKGMKQKVAIARALIHDPRLLFMDEPTANLDPESAKVVRDFILELKRQGKTVFLNTHNLDEAQRLCDRIGILKTRLLAINTPEQLAASVWGHRTAIELDAVTDAIVTAVKQLAQKHVEVDGNRLLVEVDDPLMDNPDLVQTIVAAGGRVRFVEKLEPDLEETYLRIVREQE